MKERINVLKEEAAQSILKASNLQEVEEIRVRILGKKGELTELSKMMKDLSKEERPVMGQLLNEVRDMFTALLEEKTALLKKEQKKVQLLEETIDITLPGKKVEIGGIHPITETLSFLKGIFTEMGFDIADGPEVEKVSYNFDALNIPEAHPSRNLQDTFYVNEDVVLRTHTSPVQIRYMQEAKAPFRMICPGKVYRNDYDVTHTPMFHQLEGLMVGKEISFANLKAILTEFVNKVFGETEVRFRPH
ncbi:MAG: phenylalanine--tRNA ligase subunit alpha, partial [Cetobacterium sp.]